MQEIHRALFPLLKVLHSLPIQAHGASMVEETMLQALPMDQEDCPLLHPYTNVHSPIRKATKPVRYVLNRILHKRSTGGFTLIELLVVFSLLALLLSIAVPRYLSTTEVSRERARDQNLATLRDALDKFSADLGRNPRTLDELVDKHYLRKIPTDPVSGTNAWVVKIDPSATNSGVLDVDVPPTEATDMTSPGQAPMGTVSAPIQAQPNPSASASPSTP